jgi:hypothetical protein
MTDPIHRFWSKVNDYTHTPVNAVWLVVGFCTCLDLIGIGSTLTITAIFNITAPALDISYIAVIIAHRWYEGKVQFHPGPYTMGRWSKPVNAIAVTWVIFISVVLFFPTMKPVKADNMNYAICVAAFIGLFSTVWWYAGARKTYVGPRTNGTSCHVQDACDSQTHFVRHDRHAPSGRSGRNLQRLRLCLVSQHIQPVREREHIYDTLHTHIHTHHVRNHSKTTSATTTPHLHHINGLQTSALRPQRIRSTTQKGVFETMHVIRRKSNPGSGIQRMAHIMGSFFSTF